MRHLLVTNDFPPKIGGIQSYLWELWRRLPSEDVTVMTTPYPGAEEFDEAQNFRVVRTKEKWLLPTSSLVRRINDLAVEVGAEIIVLDPVLPLGHLGPRLCRPYVVVAHGAEFSIPARLPAVGRLVRNVVGGSIGIIASGDFVADCSRALPNVGGKPLVSVPPGVDVVRFRPLDVEERLRERHKYGLTAEHQVVVGVSRLVPRKGFDRLVLASAELLKERPQLKVLIAGAGREANRLQRLIDKSGAPAVLLGRVPDANLPALHGLADVFCMPCHDRWFGLEAEGFGIVFLEAAATGTPSVAGLSGGSAEPVQHGHTGLVISGRVTSSAIAAGLAELLDDPEKRRAFADRSRALAETAFSYDELVTRLQAFLQSVVVANRK